MSYQQNMQNGYQYQQPQANFSNMNPQSFDPKVKNQLINQNIFHSGYGNYKVCLIMNSVKFPYKNSYNPGTISAVCKVLVHHKHALDIADSLSNHGINSITEKIPIPAIMYPMGKDFIGTNLESREGIYDENIILRTNYPCVIKRQNDLFTNKDNQKFVIYSNPITTIRDKNYNSLPYDDVFKTGVITVCLDRQTELLTEETDEKDKNNKNDKKKDVRKLLSANDILLLQMYIENVFQAAICGYHNILLLSIFGKEFGIPIEDQILIFNFCIMKFGHMFKAIMICIPPYEDKGLFEYIESEIIKPQEITKDIDMKYMAKNMAKNMAKRMDSDDDNDVNCKQKENQKENITQKMASMNDEERMKMLRKIVRNKHEQQKTNKNNNKNKKKNK